MSKLLRATEIDGSRLTWMHGPFARQLLLLGPEFGSGPSRRRLNR
jgi:hypothetical protein